MERRTAANEATCVEYISGVTPLEEVEACEKKGGDFLLMVAFHSKFECHTFHWPLQFTLFPSGWGNTLSSAPNASSRRTGVK